MHCSVWNTLNETRVQAAAGAFDVWRTGTLTAAETGTIYDDVFTGSTRRRHGLTAAGLGDQDWCHVTLTRMHAAAGGCQSEWTLDRRCSVDIITTLNQDGRGLAHHWCDFRPCSPHPRLPMRCMIGLPQGTWVRGSRGRCARRATCGMWAAHTRDVRSCTISYDMWPPRYRTLDESAIDIAISCNWYDH